MSITFFGDKDHVRASEWQTVHLGGFQLPGVSTVTCPVSRSIDVKKTKGKDGAALEDKGYNPAAVEIETRIHNEGEWGDMQLILAQLHPRRPGGPRSAVAISHPLPALLGIRSVYIKMIDPKFERGGLLIVKISALEWTPKPKAVTKGGGTYKGQGKAGRDPLQGQPESALDEFASDDSPVEEAQKGLVPAAQQLQEDVLEDAFGPDWRNIVNGA